MVVISVSVACFDLCCVAEVGELRVSLLVDVVDVAGVAVGLAAWEQKVDIVLWRDFGGRPVAFALPGSVVSDVFSMWPSAVEGWRLFVVVGGCFSCPVAVDSGARFVPLASLRSCCVWVSSCWSDSISIRWVARAES